MKATLWIASLLLWLCACDTPEDKGKTGQDQPEVPQEPSWEWQMIDSPTTEHIRGLRVVNDSTLWISGTSGVVFRTEDGGKHWDNLTLPKCEDLDFRDIHAFDLENAYVISAGEGVRMYRTMDAGISWYEVYQDTNAHAFYDGFDFWNVNEGLAYGDAHDGKMALLKTTNGMKWKDQRSVMPEALEGEAGFAASGTGIVVRDEHVWIATGGGETARVYLSEDSARTWTAYDTPLVSGVGMGVFSIAFRDATHGIAVGGSYLDSTSTNGNSAYTLDGGVNWMVPDSVPNGYRSCVAYDPTGKYAVCVGRTGGEWSMDDGKTWNAFSEEGFWVCQFGENTLWASGRRGKLGVLHLTP